MRVAFLNRDRHSHPGGDIIQIDATIAALSRIGIEAVYLPHDCTAADLAAFDLCHLFHCNFNWSLENWIKTIRAAKKYVLTPIFYPTHFEIIPPDVEAIVGEAEFILPFSVAEGRELEKAITSFSPPPMIPIPNGTDEAFHAPNATMEREGVLCVAAREGDKNTDRVERICKNLGIPFTLACGVPHSEMPAIYKRHRVFLNASDSERMSLTIGEALCAGCRVLATNHNRGNEWYPNLYTLDPEDKHLPMCLRYAYQGNRNWLTDSFAEILGDDPNDYEKWDYTPNEAARKLTWDSVAMRLAKVYQECLR